MTAVASSVLSTQEAAIQSGKKVLYGTVTDRVLRMFEAIRRNVRFLVTSLLWCFVLGPALAVLLTKIFPLAEPYALGLVLLGMAPCSPAIPVMMRKSGGSLAYMSAFMLLAYAGTVVLMPFMVPWLAQGFTADPWTIAKPLLLFIALPLVIGAASRLQGNRPSLPCEVKNHGGTYNVMK